MAYLQLKQELTIPQKLAQMQEDARYDVADDRDSDTCCVPDPGIFAGAKSIRSPSVPPKVPKVFLSNDCRFNCAYCGCRCTHDAARYCMEPRELASLAVEDALRNRHGVFVTSAICKSPDYTEERIVETLRIMREELCYRGYIHAKVMPGTDPLLIAEAGQYADRLSVNIEVARSEGYSRIAKQKNRENILTPMGQISGLIRQAQLERRRFATSQSTQLMAGSTGEDDRTILSLSQALYRKYRLKRVYYTAFQYRNPAQGYDLECVSTPQWRMRRLYQADRLMQLYGFSPEELAPEAAPNLSERADPKACWALRNLSRFPLEVNSAAYEELLRVPGIGIVYAKRIVAARREAALTHEHLRRLGVPLRRSVYFLTCGGKYRGGRFLEQPELYAPVFREDLPVPPEQLTFF